MSGNPHLTMSEHLNDEQFSSLLAGEDSAAARQHLEGCEECRAEMDRVAEAMEGFGALTMEWAETRSATMAPVPADGRAGWMRAVRPAAWAGGAAILAVGIAVGVHQENGLGRPVTTASSSETKESPAAVSAETGREMTREQQIAEDNRMLLAIRQELTSQDTSSSGAASTAND